MITHSILVNSRTTQMGAKNKTDFSLKCKLVSFNCHSLKRSIDSVRLLCDTADVIALQETWLLPHDIPILGSIHRDFEYTGKSAVDTSAGVLRGRPYGGVSILWRKGVFSSVSVVECQCSRISAANCLCVIKKYW